MNKRLSSRVKELNKEIRSKRKQIGATEIELANATHSTYVEVWGRRLNEQRKELEALNDQKLLAVIFGE